MPESRTGGSGRPSKRELAANSKGGRNKVGRPKGDAAIINEYKARMLASPRSKKVMDRILPVAAFEKDIVKDAGRSAIQINITGVGATSITNGAEATDQEEETVVAVQDPRDQGQH